MSLWPSKMSVGALYRAAGVEDDYDGVLSVEQVYSEQRKKVKRALSVSSMEQLVHRHGGGSDITGRGDPRAARVGGE